MDEPTRLGDSFLYRYAARHYVKTMDDPHRLTQAEALRALGPSIYAMRLMSSGMIKIGHTSMLHNRRGEIARENGEQVEILGFMAGTLADEQAIHRKLQAHRAKGREYYRATPEVMRMVNKMRKQFGLAAIE